MHHGLEHRALKCPSQASDEQRWHLQEGDVQSLVMQRRLELERTYRHHKPPARADHGQGSPKGSGHSRRGDGERSPSFCSIPISSTEIRETLG